MDEPLAHYDSEERVLDWASSPIIGLGTRTQSDIGLYWNLAWRALEQVVWEESSIPYRTASIPSWEGMAQRYPYISSNRYKTQPRTVDGYPSAISMDPTLLAHNPKP